MISINRKAVRAAGGTQSDELAAKIKSVTSSTTVGAVFVYDTRNDSDSGAWSKKTSHTSWAREAASATRSSRSEFPSVALIVADNTANTLTIYDLDDPSMPMWMVFTAANNNLVFNTFASYNCTSIYALNGRVYFGRASQYGLGLIDFAADDSTPIQRTSSTGGPVYKYKGTIAQRNDTLGVIDVNGNEIVNDAVNDVAATIVEGAEIGALGLPIPTVAVATAGGISVILANGTVSNSSSTSARYQVAFDENNRLWAANANNGSLTHIQFTDLGEWFTGSWGATLFAEKDHSSASSYFPNYLGSDAEVAIGSGREVFAGTDEGLNVFQFNRGNPAESAVAYITSAYNTGYMLGDIRGAWLANPSSTTDRSVKGNNLTANGTITTGFVATDAELKYYDGFSASNYFSRAYDADFDFGTGDFSIMFWVKLADTVNTTETVLERGYGGNAFFNIDFESGVPRLIAYNGSAFDTTTGTRDLSDNQWHQLMCFRKSGVAYIYIDGKQHVSNAMTYDLDNNQGILHIGQNTGNGNPLANGSLSLLRISATAPTPQQAADIYREEAKLFRSGAKCLLQQTGNTNVNDLSYDKTTDLLTVCGTNSANGSTIFRGLEAVDTFNGQDHDSTWSSGSINIVASAGGVSGYYRSSGSGGGLVLDLPAIDVRGDINTADSKLPDDGKLHFSGVTTSNGGNVIGHIPIGENENVTVKAHVTAKGYGSNLGTHYANYVLTEQFYRAAGGDVTSAVAEASIVSQESAAGLDATLGVDTSADTAKITVTGDASDRIVWTASVEVIRDAEKSYER